MSTPTQPESDVQRGFAAGLIYALRGAWLEDFSIACNNWQSADADTRHLITTVAERWLMLPAGQKQASSFNQEVVSVQLLNFAGRRGREPKQYLRELLKSAPKRHLVWPWLRRVQPALPESWRDIENGVSGLPWRLKADAWASLTPVVREFVAGATLEIGRMPLTMQTASDLAWLDRANPICQISEERLLIAYRDLPSDAGDRLAVALLQQYLAWHKAGVDHQSLSGKLLYDQIPNILAQLAWFHAPHSGKFLDFVKAAGIRFPQGIFRGQLGNELADPAPAPYLPTGVTLVTPVLPENRKEALFPVLRAGHGEQIHLQGKPNPMFVLLDIDLTRPEMAFLGLKGQRLRICDSANHLFTRCFTKVYLDGRVELWDGFEPPSAKDVYLDSTNTLVCGRQLVSPFEGMHDSGWLGATARIGGVPQWEQDEETPCSPANGKRMTFIAQFHHPLGGTAYVFLDYDAMIATVVTQRD